LKPRTLKGKTDVLKNLTSYLRGRSFFVKGKRDVLIKPLFFLLLFFCSNISMAQQFDTVIAIVEPPEPDDEDTVYYDYISRDYLPTLQKRNINQATVSQLQQNEDFWYANKELRKKEKVPQKGANFWGELMQEKWVKTLLWILIIGAFVAIVTWYLASLNIRLLRKPSGIIETHDVDKMPEDIFSIPYEKSIREAIQKNDFRLAVRLYYLQTLMHLSQKELIQFKQDKTNSQYLAQLYNTKFYKDFFSLTRNFEYTWYGQFPLTQNAFVLIQNDFETFKSRLA